MSGVISHEGIRDRSGRVQREERDAEALKYTSAAARFKLGPSDVDRMHTLSSESEDDKKVSDYQGFPDIQAEEIARQNEEKQAAALANVESGADGMSSWEGAAAHRAERDRNLLEDKRLRMIAIIRGEGSPDYIMAADLRSVGVTLAELPPDVYNNGQVARDSDGLQKLDKVA